jgi:hypothetical protein
MCLLQAPPKSIAQSLQGGLHLRPLSYDNPERERSDHEEPWQVP